jgi:hypothetical protein
MFVAVELELFKVSSLTQKVTVLLAVKKTFVTSCGAIAFTRFSLAYLSESETVAMTTFDEPSSNSTTALGMLVNAWPKRLALSSVR